MTLDRNHSRDSVEARARLHWWRARNANRPRHDGYIYFIGTATGPIKIGFAEDVAHRLRDLQCANPDELQVYAAIPADRPDELRLHRAVDFYRLRGEWFEREAALALIAAWEAGRNVMQTVRIGQAASLDQAAEGAA